MRPEPQIAPHLATANIAQSPAQPQARPARTLPLWPLIAVIVLYGITFAAGFMASNDAEQRFAAADRSVWTQTTP